MYFNKTWFWKCKVSKFIRSLRSDGRIAQHTIILPSLVKLSPRTPENRSVMVPHPLK